MSGNVCIFTFTVSKGWPASTHAVPPKKAVEVKKVAEGYHNCNTYTQTAVLGKITQKAKINELSAEKDNCTDFSRLASIVNGKFSYLNKKIMHKSSNSLILVKHFFTLLKASKWTSSLTQTGAELEVLFCNQVTCVNELSNIFPCSEAIWFYVPTITKPRKICNQGRQRFPPRQEEDCWESTKTDDAL